MIPQKQLSLADIFEDCKDIYESDKPHFLTLLENHIDLDKIIPTSFTSITTHPLEEIVNILACNALGFDYSTPLFYSNRFPPVNLPSLFQTSEGILWLY